MAQIFEIIMVLSFGASWPMNVRKSWQARTTKGKSLMFLLLILFGYIAGITSKLIDKNYNFSTHWYVLVFYILNFILVFTDTMIYFRNRKLDKLAEEKAEK